MKSLKILFATAIALSVTNAWANLKTSTMSNSYCSPKVHFKLPDGWTSAYLMIAGQGVPFPTPKLGDNGWTVLDLGVTKTNDSDVFYINGDNKNDCNDGHCVTRIGVNLNGQQVNNAQTQGWRCSDIGTEGEIWIQDHPDPQKEGQVYVTTSQPVVKDFYIFLPDNTTWRSSTPMIDEDGKPHALQVDNDHCGWYYRRYILDGKIDKALPSSVILYREDDPEKNGAIGMGGEKALNEDQAAEPIALADFFALFEADPNYADAVYFLADEEQADALGGDTYGWFATRPSGVVGNCQYNLAAVIYDTDAQLHPLFSCYADGATEGRDGCQKSAASQSAIYSCMGVHQGLVESTLSVENGKKKMKLTSAGKKCFLDQGTFDQMFNITKGVNEASCFDVTFTRAKDGKWEFDSDYFVSPGLKTPVQGGFFPVEATTDADILMAEPSQTLAPLARTKRPAEGPIYYGPLLRANDPTEQVPKIDVYCEGPGWPKKAGVSYDCEGLFADGDGTTSRINSDLKLAGVGGNDACVFGWSCNDKGSAPEGWPFYSNGSEAKGTETGRWQSTEDSKSLNGGRNQHFCFESHANFRFKKGLKFNFRGDDDIWVFIDNKLAVDLGGTHLAAPGYVDLDYFMKNVGGYSNLDEIVGKSYDIDIYFCDRRTTVSDIRIKTNMFLEQTIAGIIIEELQILEDYITDDKHFKICYKKSGNGSCAAAMGGYVGNPVCGAEITDKISYILSNDKTAQDPTKTIVSEDAFTANPKQFCNGRACGIDVTKPYAPIINEKQLESYLSPGKYYLVVKIGGDTRAIEFNIKGNVGIANREAVPVDDNNVKGFTHPFRSQAMASSLKEDDSPDINQMIPLYVANITNPCTTADCSDPLEMHAIPGASYNLQVSSNKVIFYEMKNGKLTIFNPSANRNIGASGIDTIYATIPIDKMETAVEKVSVNVKGSSYKAEISFFVPRLVFVDSDSTYKVVSQDYDTEMRMKGSSYPFYLVAVKGDDSPCEELCNFSISKGAKTSSGVNIVAGSQVVNGRATLIIQSQKAYEKNADGSGTATLHIVGPNANLMQATYTNLQFLEPPVPTPLFADIFDVHGVKSASDLNIPTPYFSKDQEYLDGIGDSLVVYYTRNFIKDSLPEKIAVFWDSDKDSVVFEKSEIKKGAVCGDKAGLPDSLCLGRISLSGKKLSKKVKTSGMGKLTSWALYTARGVPIMNFYMCSIYDRIAPIILSANAFTDKSTSNIAQLQVTFSEKVEKTTVGAKQGDKVFSFYINAGKNPHFEESISLAPSVAYGNKFDSVHTFIYSQKSTFPQVGDYINFRNVNGTGLVSDQSDYASAYADTARPSNDITKQWNIALGYNAKTHLPSPWVLITKGSSASQSSKSSSSSKNSKSSSSGKIASSSSSSIDYAKPSFRVKMISPFEFDIVLDDDLPSLAKQYAVMDMKGQVLSVGELSNTETRVKVSTPGSYVVRVGLGYRQVNVK